MVTMNTTRLVCFCKSTAIGLVALGLLPTAVRGEWQRDDKSLAWANGTNVFWRFSFDPGKGKPFFVATGASTIGEVQKAVHAILKINKQLVLMQCNTNYTANPNNYDHLHINVLKTYATMFPDVILGLSDHTHAVAPVVAAVTLGARVIERHFTDSNEREGPDHKFAMNPENWAKMVAETRLLERAHPTFHNSLINAVQLESHEELPGSVRAGLFAVTSMSRLPLALRAMTCFSPLSAV